MRDLVFILRSLYFILKTISNHCRIPSRGEQNCVFWGTGGQDFNIFWEDTYQPLRGGY